MELTIDELKEWRNDPITKAVIDELKIIRQGELEKLLHKESLDVERAIGIVLGFERAIQHISEGVLAIYTD